MSDRQGFRKAASERAAAEDFIAKARAKIIGANPGPLAMCPHCGETFEGYHELIPYHDYPKPCRQVCPGSKQIPRCSESDGRPLWNGESNPHFYRNQERQR